MARMKYYGCATREDEMEIRDLIEATDAVEEETEEDVVEEDDDDFEEEDSGDDDDDDDEEVEAEE